MKKFDEVFDSCIRFWPDTIDIGDGKLIEETGGFYSETLSTAWNYAEKAAKDEWQSLMVWVIYRYLHKKSFELYRAGEFQIVSNKVETFEIKKNYKEALSEPGYEKLIINYSE